MRLRTASVVSLIVTVMLIAAPAAVGLEPGVHVDPHSPSGTEYSFPLGSTRQQLGGPSSDGNLGLESGFNEVATALTWMF